jgi:hypothetical protein
MILAFAQPILAAAGGDIVIKLILGVIVLIFMVVKQLFEANKGAGLKAKLPQPPQPMPQPPVKGAVPPAAQAGQQADPLRAQVEEFLRRASKQQQPAPPQAPQRLQPARASEIEILVDPSRQTEQRNIGQPLRQAEWRKTLPTAPASPSAGTPADKPRQIRGSKPRRRQSVAEHVAEQVTAHTRSLADKASQLGQRIVAEDQQFDVQLKAKFDHTVGTLAGTATSAAAAQSLPASDTPAAQIASLLANPSGIRQAVLINEILRRPSDRW